MKNFPPLLLLTLAAFLTTCSEVRALLAYDDAGNYANGWTNFSNGGQGFQVWQFNIVANPPTSYAGAFIGNPADAGITGMGAQAFGLYANPAITPFEGRPTISAFRRFAAPLAVGNTFSFQWAVNADSGSLGQKGFYLYSPSGPGTLEAVVSVVDGPSGILEISTLSPFVNTGIASGTGPMTWTFTLQTATTLLVTSSARDGSTNPVFSTSFSISNRPTAFGFTADNLAAGDDRQPYFNNLKIVPEPSTWTLLVLSLGAWAIGLLRSRRNKIQSASGATRR
jgi:hypothetical protein